MENHIKAATEAHANLNTWAAVVALLENGLLIGNRTFRPAEKIIAICKKEMQKELAVMDKETEKAVSA